MNRSPISSQNNIERKRYSELSEEERDEFQFSAAEFLIVVSFVIAGTLFGAILDHWKVFGFLPEGLVRALAGTADTLGFAILGLYVSQRFRVNPALDKVVLRVFGLKRDYSKDSLGEYTEWVKGGLIGLTIAFFLQAIVFRASDDPHGLVGVIYAFGFSNLDNSMAGLSVLRKAIMIYGWRNGLSRYWTHPFYVGNFIMIISIPLVSFVFRLLSGFRPDLNVQAGIESGLMDVDTIGAFLIFLLSTRVLDISVPAIETNRS